MTESEFRTKRRQKFLTLKYFALNEAEIEFDIIATLEAKQKERLTGTMDPSIEGHVFKEKLKRVRLHYTAGNSVESLRPLFADALKWFGEWHRAYRAQVRALAEESGDDLRTDGTPLPFEDLFHFQLALDMVSIGTLLGDVEAVRIVATWLERYRGADMLFESIVEPSVPDPRIDVEEFFHEPPYDPLLDAIFAAETPEGSSAFVKKYLDGWYKAFEGVPWHNGHLIVNNEYSNYQGYWSFEAAAVCLIHGIDDSSFRDHMIYPKDLADWARTNDSLARLKPGSALEATDAISRLRCEAGQPCPREGWWFSPARVNSRRHFALGEAMPELGGDYGATIWQWDEKQ